MNPVGIACGQQLHRNIFGYWLSAGLVDCFTVDVVDSFECVANRSSHSNRFSLHLEHCIPVVDQLLKAGVYSGIEFASKLFPNFAIIDETIYFLYAFLNHCN